MLKEYQEEWIELSQPEQVEEPVYLSTGPTARLRRKCFLFLIFIFISLILIVAQNEQLVQASCKLVEIKEQAAELEKENQLLRIDIAKLKSPERIEDIAINQLWLVLPDTKDPITSL